MKMGTTITFTNKPPVYFGKQRQCDIMKKPLGLRGIEKNCKTEMSEIEYPKLIITQEMIDVIAENTNIVIADIPQARKIWKVSIFEINYARTDSNTSWTYLISGTLQPYKQFYQLFDAKGFLVFGVVMSQDRFKFLLPKISFDTQKHVSLQRRNFRSPLQWHSFSKMVVMVKNYYGRNTYGQLNRNTLGSERHKQS